MGKLDQMQLEHAPSFSVEMASLEDVPAIIRLQEENLPKSLSEQDIKDGGFLTLKNTNDELCRFINNSENNIFTVKDNKELVAFLMSAGRESTREVHFFNDFLEKLKSVKYHNVDLDELNFCNLLQICIEKNHRGKGIIDILYKDAKDKLSERYDLGIGEISFKNEHSLEAHKNVGFEVIDNYIDSNKRDWHIVALNFKQH